MRVLLLTPPMTQLNTPYPATAYLTGFLRGRRLPWLESVEQADPALELVLRIFSKKGLAGIEERLRSASVKSADPAIRNFLKEGARYREVIEPVIRFLQGKDPSLALRIAS